MPGLEERAEPALARASRPPSREAYRDAAENPRRAPVRPDAAAARRRRVECDRKEYVMFKTILWATDGSETAARALPFALASPSRPGEARRRARARDLRRPRRRLSRCSPTRPSCARSPAGRRPHRRARATFIVRTCTPAMRRARSRRSPRGRRRPDRRRHARLRPGRTACVGSVTQGLLHAGVCPVLAIPTGAPARRRAELERAYLRTPAGKPQHGSVGAPMLRLLREAKARRATRRPS